MLSCSCWFAPFAFLYLPGPPAQAWHSLHWVLPHQSSVKKIPHRLVNRPVRWRHFLTRGSFFPDNFSLCQLTIQMAWLVVTGGRVTVKGMEVFWGWGKHSKLASCDDSILQRLYVKSLNCAAQVGKRCGIRTIVYISGQEDRTSQVHLYFSSCRDQNTWKAT